VDDLLVFFAENTLGALILALCVFTVTRVWRNPPVVHVLWLLVLAKLVAPPLVGVDWKAVARFAQSAAPERTVTNPSPPSPSHGANDRLPSLKVAGELPPPRLLPQTLSNDELAPQPIRPESAVVTTAERRDTDVVSTWQRVSIVLFWLWLAGAACFATIAAIRVARFYRRLRYTLPASERFQVMGREIAERFGLRRAPNIRYVDCGGPLVYCLARRPVILLPIDLFRQLDDEQASMILAHEMAHLCRRDHWVRLFELVVSVVYWWNPLVWFVRRPLHSAEEQCCDAWVRWAFPESAKRYAEVVLLAADASNLGGTSQPVLASSFLRRHSVKERIEMILKSRLAPQLSPRGKALFCLLALVALPLFAQSAKSQAQQRSDVAEQATGTQQARSLPPGELSPSILRATVAVKFPRVPERPSDADFPHVVHFEQGASKLLDGDRIDITEVRGTAATMAPGNLYWIKGTYALASHDRASLMASVTAALASEGTGPTLKTQSVDVTKGRGTFTLLYAMICKGWPHVSFYPKGNGSDFGGTYFGTGEFVLRKWWGEERELGSLVPNGAEGMLVRPSHYFPYAVRFELGETQFLPGDQITITEVRGTADRIALSQIYCVKGRYTLASHDRAQLSVGITADNAADGTRTGFKPQDTTVTKGKGTFTLFLPMTCKGWPHVSFYPAAGGDGFGGVYFGTGDSVARPKTETSSSKPDGDAQLEGPPPKLLPKEVVTDDPLTRRIWESLGLRFKNEPTRNDNRKFPYEGGLWIEEVRPDSPASRGSIKKDDVLIGIDDYATLELRNVLWILNHAHRVRSENTKLQAVIFRSDEAPHVQTLEIVVPSAH
jgi:beta-lactamase regulating signal transducer with metallopeptidase domain